MNTARKLKLVVLDACTHDVGDVGHRLHGVGHSHRADPSHRHVQRVGGSGEPDGAGLAGGEVVDVGVLDGQVARERCAEHRAGDHNGKRVLDQREPSRGSAPHQNLVTARTGEASHPGDEPAQPG